MTNEEKKVAEIILREDGDYVLIRVPHGTVRVFLDDDRVTAAIENETGEHVMSTWAEFEELIPKA